MTKQFEFADFIDEFKVTFTLLKKGSGHYATNGKWIEGADEVPEDRIGIILPLTTDDLKHEVNGKYSENDRKIYTLQPMEKGQRIQYEGKTFLIDGTKDFSAYADVYIYFAKGVE